MKLRLNEKRQAIALRQDGLTYNEIRAVIPGLSKATLSGWLKNINLTTNQRKRILDKIHSAAQAGRLKGSWTNRVKAEERIAQITNTALQEYIVLSKDPRFLVGVALYWAEGAKVSRSFQFINSDPKMIKTMMSWLRHVCKVNADQIGIRIYAHKIYADKNLEEYWAKIVNIPASDFKKTIYKPTPWTTKKNPSYVGCCRIEVRGSDLYWKTIAWIAELEKLYYAPIA